MRLIEFSTFGGNKVTVNADMVAAVTTYENGAEIHLKGGRVPVLDAYDDVVQRLKTE